MFLKEEKIAVVKQKNIHISKAIW